MKRFSSRLSGRAILLLMALLFGAQDCDALLEEKVEAPPLPANMIEGEMPVLSVDSVFAAGEETMVTLTVQSPDPCWSYHRYDAKRDGRTLLVKIFGKREKDAMCAQMISSFQATLGMPVEEARIKFWQSAEATLDTTIRVQ
ncbi:MAG: hypothetical protein ACRBF0_01055 [Calditrichia bacterium]